jgi:2-polyprenyl-3-methyl-5-hydroxy-6-metoxy-1,4-benzoquinol methylase
VYSRESIRPGGTVLDLCCGDGFFSHRFYSTVAGSIEAVDVDPIAIAHARRYHQLPNIHFEVCDVVRDALPVAAYDTVIWDGAIEHFSEAEIVVVLERLAKLLVPGGLIHGMTVMATGLSQSPFHEHEFGSREQLEQLLTTVFPHAVTFVRMHPARTCLYFRAARIPIEDALRPTSPLERRDVALSDNVGSTSVEPDSPTVLTQPAP